MRVSCPSCGEVFQQTKDRLVYCSRPCRDAGRVRFYAVARAERPAAVRPPPEPRSAICRACGESFIQPTGGRRLYCGDKCRRASALASAHASYHRTYIPTPERAYECAECGASFVRSGRHGQPTICGSEVCIRAQARDLRARRRTRFSGGERIYRIRVFSRDGWRCQLCGKAMRRDAVVPHPLAPTIDHIVPLAAGGRHTWTNVQAAHFLLQLAQGSLRARPVAVDSVKGDMGMQDLSVAVSPRVPRPPRNAPVNMKTSVGAS